MLSIIQEYSNHLEEIFENSFDYIYLHDKEGNILDVNNIVVKNLGYSKKEILDMKVTDFLLEEVKSEVIDDIKNTIETGLVNKPKTYKVRKKDGTCIYVEVSAIPLKKNGEIYAILGIGHDLTIYKKAEQKLRESEKKFRHLFNQSPFSISLFDIKGNLLESNQKFIRNLANYTDKDYIGKHFIEIALDFQNSKELIELYRKRNKALRKGEILSPEEFCLITLDGKKIWLYFLSSLVTIGSENYIQVLIQDITEMKKAEQKLKESEQKFRNITEQSFMGIVIIQGGELKYINNAMAKISGYPIEEVLNWSEKDIVKILFPDDVEIILKRLESNREGNMGPYSSNAFRIINKDGNVRWLEDYTTRIIYQGELANLISIVDITDRKQAEQLIIEENIRLLELHELRKDLITRVSHELKTPMTSIYGASQILTKLYMNEIGEEPKKYIEIGHRGCLRLKQLIDNLLDVSRLDAKKFELKLQRENLVEHLVDCVKDMNYLAADRQIKMIIELPDEVFLDIDRLRFRQVLTNILSNAIKNTPIQGEIFIDLAENTEFIDIRVKDTGVGLTEKEKEKLFKKFGKIERYGMDLGVDIEGSGLGLYISKEIVELHGGQIFVDSEGRKKGSTFTIRLFKN